MEDLSGPQDSIFNLWKAPGPGPRTDSGQHTERTCALEAQNITISRWAPLTPRLHNERLPWKQPWGSLTWSGPLQNA